MVIQHYYVWLLKTYEFCKLIDLVLLTLKLLFPFLSLCAKLIAYSDGHERTRIVLRAELWPFFISLTHSPNFITIMHPLPHTSHRKEQLFVGPILMHHCQSNQ